MKRLILATLFIGVSLCPGATIIQNTLGTGTGSAGIFGQSFTTPDLGPWTELTFNFFSDVLGTTPSAAGTAFLLSQIYTGTPAALSGAIPGFLAASTGTMDGKYVFETSVQILANTQYFIYANAIVSVTGGNQLPGDSAYFAPDANSNFIAAGASANFNLSGTAASVPEPTSVGLALMGLGAMAMIANRRRTTH